MHKSVVASSLLLLALAGCSSKESQLVGKWKFKDMSTASGQNAAAAQMAQGLLSSMTAEFKSDKTYSMGGLANMEGTWTLSGNTVTMSPTKVMGMDIAQFKQQAEASGKMTAEQKKQMDDKTNQTETAILSDDGKTLMLTAKGKTNPGSLTFAKDTDSK